MKAYTDIEQSKMLAEILPIESADMAWYPSHSKDGYSIRMLNDTNPLDIIGDEHDEIPAWSLAALVEQLPVIEGCRPYTTFDTLSGEYEVSYVLVLSADVLYVHASNLLDACVEMIIKLHEQKLL